MTPAQPVNGSRRAGVLEPEQRPAPGRLKVMESSALPQIDQKPQNNVPQLSRYAWLSIATAVVTISLKSGAYLLTGSVGLLSDAVESLVNLVAAVVALIALRIAARPADENHHYGHGKAEYFSAGLEGIMIFAAAAVIIISSVQRFLHPQPLESLGPGLIISIVASVLNGLVGMMLIRAGRAHRSVTLTADGKHLLTDVWTSAGVIVGILLVWVTGWERLDPVVAAAVGVNIIVTGFRLVAQSAVALLDVALPPEDEKRLQAALAGFRSAEIDTVDVRTRQSGQNRFVSLTLRVPGDWTVGHAHDLADQIEAGIAKELTGVNVQTHIEPYPAPAHA
jgi:cation diffusion facilitator family transporter